MPSETLYSTGVPSVSEDKCLDTPVLFMIFSQPDTTRVIFEEIRKARPKQLFVAADGPRLNKPGEAEKCEETRKVVELVDWPCEVHTLFREKNLGCGRAVSGAISWFFEHVEEGIILEDDTLPSQDFFRFCSELLERFREDTRIWAISGSCLPSSIKERSEYSYFLSKWDYIWGWATWRRAWKHYDYKISLYGELVKKGYFHPDYSSLYEAYFMKHAFDKAYYKNDKVTWWDYQWGFTRKINSGLVVVPVDNMVINLGLGNGATNTKSDTKWNFLKLEKLEFPLKHPKFIMHDRITDDEVFRRYMTTPFSRMKAHVKRMAEYIGLGKGYEVLARARRR